VETTSLDELVKSVETNVGQFIQAYRAVNPRARAGGAAAVSRTRTRRVQERLRAAGFSPGPLDGQLGPQTQQALRRYQHAKGLRVTGTLDARTLKALGIQ
jgi:peptidoglycan hydrolase-like protein with peptidoglycan-binding domain